MTKAIILAGGKGSRIGMEIPKQFLEIKGKLMIEHAIEAFENHPLIDAIVIVSHPDYLNKVKDLVTQKGYHKVNSIVSGGCERSDSSKAALLTCIDPNEILLFHDCARPFVSNHIIDECIKAMANHDAVTVAIPSTDTVYITNEEGEIVDIPSRQKVFQAQTPQCFRMHLIQKAYELASLDSQFHPTDDCSVVFHYLPNTKIYIVPGDIHNAKITYSEDFKHFSQN